MNMSTEATDIVVKAATGSARAALRVTGRGAKKLNGAVTKIIKNAAERSGKSEGRTNLRKMLKEGGRLDVYLIEEDKMPLFSAYGEKYGILYSAVREKEFPGKYILLCRGEDRAKTELVLNLIANEKEAREAVAEESRDEWASLADRGEEGFLGAVNSRRETKNRGAAPRERGGRSEPRSSYSNPASTDRAEGRESVRAALKRFIKEERNARAPGERSARAVSKAIAEAVR